ncbi:hypothetical protein BV20DRAFT_56062 [Pilatotrama ljubarskyi]|nr:hypothetical protein BV20DRAFT_56062 [Pilatotrama ljubarskyi]
MLERLADGPCDSACAGPILLLRRMLRISEVWPYDKPVDSLFFPVIAKYIERHCSCDVEELALAILRNVLLEVPHFPRHGFPSGSEDVMRGLGVIASRRKPEPPPVSCSAYTLFVTRALALYANKLRTSSSPSTHSWKRLSGDNGCVIRWSSGTASISCNS